MTPDQHHRLQQVCTSWEYRPTLLFVALRTALVALLAFILAVMPDDFLCGWFVAGASAMGLLLLIVEEIRQREPEAEREEHGNRVRLASTQRANVNRTTTP
jgi:hypothetical protein